MSWNYRIVRRVHKTRGCGPEVEEVTYAVHEAFYQEDKPTSISTEPTNVVAETLDELTTVLAKMTEALSKPILNYEDFDEK